MNLNQVDVSKLPADIRKQYKQLQVMHAERKIQNKAKVVGPLLKYSGFIRGLIDFFRIGSGTSINPKKNSRCSCILPKKFPL